jgi:UDP-2,3-diacylglucosamine hydrolase
LKSEPDGACAQEPAPSATLLAQAHWRQLALVSDLHLGPQAPRTTAAFLGWLRGPARRADALLILGDLFEAWVGDDLLEHAPGDAHHAVCEALAALSTGGCSVGVQRGNRDFLLGGGFARRCGARLLDDPCVLQLGAQRILLSHGDALCIDDQAYLGWRATCRDPRWQAGFLAQPLALRQQQALAAREQSRRSQAAMEGLGDADPGEARRWLLEAKAPWMIHGHTHRPRDHWQGAQLRQVLSDWDLDHAARPRAQVLWLLPRARWIGVERENLGGGPT